VRAGRGGQDQAAGHQVPARLLGPERRGNLLPDLLFLGPMLFVFYISVSLLERKLLE
jgi:hypothetical protein